MKHTQRISKALKSDWERLGKDYGRMSEDYKRISEGAQITPYQFNKWSKDISYN